MNNNKRNVHNSGPLGMLVKNGQIRKIEGSEPNLPQSEVAFSNKSSGHYFRTDGGVEFVENELLLVNPNECEPWLYANRQENEMGNLDELINSIQENKQLQPALIRPHPKPHDNIKYEVIFGRRRHAACLYLNIPFLVIKKDIKNIQEAIITQDAENKFRKDVSNYSNAMLYKRLLKDGVFKTEKELAQKLKISQSTLNDLMAYSRIPLELVNVLSNIHELSNSMVLKIDSLLNKDPKILSKLISIAPFIGNTLTSPVKLEKALEKKDHIRSSEEGFKAKIIRSAQGQKLFTLKISHKGVPSISIHKRFDADFKYELLCDHLKQYLENIQSGAPDQV